jgi:hypothetical protein
MIGLAAQGKPDSNPNFQESSASDTWGSTSEQFPHETGFLRAAKLMDPAPERIKAMFNAEKIEVYSVDIDQDGETDYVAQLEKKACFVSSLFQKQSCFNIVRVSDGFSYRWFAKVGNSLLLFLMDGDEDYSDYKVCLLNRQTWRIEKIAFINPLIQSDDSKQAELYWGYPWDIKDIIVMSGEKGPLLRAIVDLKAVKQVKEFLRGEINPMLYFSGSSNQDTRESLRPMLGKEKYISLEQFFDKSPVQKKSLIDLNTTP